MQVTEACREDFKFPCKTGQWCITFHIAVSRTYAWWTDFLCSKSAATYFIRPGEC